MRVVRRVAIGFAIGAATGAYGCCLALAASPHPKVRTVHGCYRVGQPVRVSGSGFEPKHLYDIAIGGVDFGQRTTDATGSFRARLIPGGLGGGIVQHVNYLNATDGTKDATTTFTLTRGTGARFLATGGDPNTLRAPFQAWGFALDGKRRGLYLHYVGPSGRVRTTAFLGHTGGRCGYLQTKSRLVFPFNPTLGRWTLQIDWLRGYSSRPAGRFARILVRVGPGGTIGLG
jgi:hypothetical protein